MQFKAYPNRCLVVRVIPVVGITPVAQVGVAHARLAAEEVVLNAAVALPAALAAVAAVDLRQAVAPRRR